MCIKFMEIDGRFLNIKHKRTLCCYRVFFKRVQVLVGGHIFWCVQTMPVC